MPTDPVAAAQRASAPAPERTWEPRALALDAEEIEATLARARAAEEAGVLVEGDAPPADADAGMDAADAADADVEAAADAAEAGAAPAEAEEAPALPALDLYLAVLRADPENAAAREAVEALAGRIVERGREAIAAGRLADAAYVAALLRGLPAGIADAEREAYADALDEANVLAGEVARGEALRREGRVLEPADENAAAVFRAVLAQAPAHVGALAGVARIQDALIAEADAAAAEGDYALAERRLSEADAVLPGQQRVQDASVRIVEARQRRAVVLAEEIETALAALELERAQELLEAYAAASTRAAGVNRLRERIETARRYGHFDAGQGVRDPLQIGGSGPELVVVPWGSFRMGSSRNEPGHDPNEAPQHTVEFARGFAVSVAPITVAEFRRFSEATGYIGTAQARGASVVYNERSGSLVERRGVDYRHDHAGARADPDLPVVHVSWLDASAYADWLSQQTGQRYRLPSEAEYEYMLRAGSDTRYPWGDALPERVVGNLPGDGDESPTRRGWGNAFPNYADGFWGLAPVRSFEANAFGLYDMVGNVSEWTEDCWHDSYRRAPRDGSAWVNPGCARRVVRGTSWASSPDEARSAYRIASPAEATNARLGFRVVREI
ncbi:SUMF1/EgtB/PvdO family nonheme iron enzyme [Coralloluteibacterium thermophilus]|uniref:SUMF1/EgtB/PvdO family nonheme iron enzyme n=1 Tax=Coralloluteibacterium thermophilum TaxID=2707049 RepID=A0ABV9NLC9_9GAMM